MSLKRPQDAEVAPRKKMRNQKMVSEVLDLTLSSDDDDDDDEEEKGSGLPQGFRGGPEETWVVKLESCITKAQQEKHRSLRKSWFHPLAVTLDVSVLRACLHAADKAYVKALGTPLPKYTVLPGHEEWNSDISSIASAIG